MPVLYGDIITDGQAAETRMTDEEKQRLMDYKNTFLPEAGKRVLADLKKKARYDNLAVPKDSLGRVDPWEIVRREAQRNVITNIIKQIEKVPKE